MIDRLRFGIPSLDNLFGERTEVKRPGERNRDKAAVESSQDQQGAVKKYGIHLPDKDKPSSISLCIIGPDGTGKSVLALHLASRYLADCIDACRDRNNDNEVVLPKVLYVSSDLKHKMAQKMWDNFALNRPFDRKIPFDESTGRRRSLYIEIIDCEPLGSREPERDPSSKKLSSTLSILTNMREARERKEAREKGVEVYAEVYFVDLASFTAGDDWGFVNRVLAVLDDPRDRPASTCHLMVIDSVEGFETLVGEQDAFGESHPRRSRIAQVMRSAAEKCHIVFIAEEHKENERLPEEFVTDAVVRLRTVNANNYVRRSIEVEKARGQSHVRGQHHYVIRDGSGSTTGEKQNPDDPQVIIEVDGGEKKYQGYVHVCPSLHKISRGIMETKGIGLPARDFKRYAAFGIPHLDNMLAGEDEETKQITGYDTRGLICSTTTALIGDPETEKTQLSYAFLSRCFTSYAKRFCDIVDALEGGKEDCNEECFQSLYEAIAHKLLWAYCLAGGFSAPSDTQAVTEEERKNADCSDESSRPSKIKKFDEEFRSLFYDITNRCKLKTPFRTQEEFAKWLQLDFQLESSKLSKEQADGLMPFLALPENDDWRKYVSDLRELLRGLSLERGRRYMEDIVKEFDKDTTVIETRREIIENTAWLLCEPYHIHDGVPILLTTKETHVERLANTIWSWLLKGDEQLAKMHLKEMYSDDKYHTKVRIDSSIEKAIKLHIRNYTICRRLEIHDLSSPILIHILQRNVQAAQKLLFHDSMPQKTESRFKESWRIRLVIDDFSILRKTYPDVSNDPLVLPYLMFYMRWEGVTSLIVDTQTGRPDMPVSDPVEKALRTLVQHHLYTWRLPFYERNPIAIAAIPPISAESTAVVRELRESSADDDASKEDTPFIKEARLNVDPHFELYTGIETGKPKPVPLEIRLYAETTHIQKYIDDENTRYCELFTPIDDGAEHHVINGLGADDYDVFRDLCYLQHDTRLDHTLVFQVDEFWVLRRPKGRRAGAARLLNNYLTAYTTGDHIADPFTVFQQTVQGEKRKFRLDFFNNKGYKIGIKKKGIDQSSKPIELSQSIDRIPFIWDFGFLLCRKNLWDVCADKELPLNKGVKVGDVWDGLPIVIRTYQSAIKLLEELEPFIKSKETGYVGPKHDAELVEKCIKRVEEMIEESRRDPRLQQKYHILLKDQPNILKNNPDKAEAIEELFKILQNTTPESESNSPRTSWRSFLEACHCVAKEASRAVGKPIQAFDLSVVAPESLSCLILEIWASEIYKSLDKEKRKSFVGPFSKGREWETPGQNTNSHGLLGWLQKYDMPLFKTWLLLIEVINLSELAESIRKSGLVGKPADRTAVAARYWYKTACELTDDFSTDDPLVPVGLPGHFSVRGDWFLAVAGGSRSERLADRALDLLSSRRSNISRLEKGIGLPTRDIGEGYLRSKMVTLGRGGRQSKVTYDDLCYLGAKDNPNFFWLWRSRLRDYPRHVRIWQEWLEYTILWWDLLKSTTHKDRWTNGFQRYDEICKAEKEGNIDYINKIESWKRFREFLDRLRISLEEATLHHSDD